MKKIANLLAICFLAGIIAACGGQKKTETGKTAEIANTEEVDTTIYGSCGEATMMNSLELITDKGDTLTILLNAPDSTTTVLGGLLVGDRMAVTAYRGADNEQYAQTVFNLTTLTGKWASIDRTFEILENGTVVCNQQEPKPYVDWRILNGKLILTADTFGIYSLGADSLLLENADGIFAYKRVTK